MDLARCIYQNDRQYTAALEDLLSIRTVIDYLYHENLYVRDSNNSSKKVYCSTEDDTELTWVLQTLYSCYSTRMSLTQSGYEGESVTPDFSGLEGLETRIARALDDYRDRGVDWLYYADINVEVCHPAEDDIPLPIIRSVDPIPFLLFCRQKDSVGTVLQMGAILTEADGGLESALRGFGIHCLLADEESNITDTVSRFLSRVAHSSGERVCDSETELDTTRDFAKTYEKNRVLWCRYVAGKNLQLAQKESRHHSLSYSRRREGERSRKRGCSVSFSGVDPFIGYDRNASTVGNNVWRG